MDSVAVSLSSLQPCPAVKTAGQDVIVIFSSENLFQDFSRSHSVDFIDLHFKSEVLTTGEENIPAGAVLIPGLNILGGVWDPEGGCLTDLSPNSPTINKYSGSSQYLTGLHSLLSLRMPPVVIRPSQEVPDESLYECPVFRTSRRGGGDNLCMVINLPIAGSNTTWIERGVALTIENKVKTV